jgi:AP-3 complex subunit beta
MLTVDNAKIMLLRSKPPSSSLPLEDDRESDPSTEVNGPFRFGTLSSLVSHRARKAYLPLPQWAEKDSPASLRDPPSPAATHVDEVDYGWKVGKEATNGGFYDSGDESASSSSSENSSESSSESDSSSSGEESTSSSPEDSSSSGEDSDSDSDDSEVAPPPKQSFPTPIINGGGPTIPSPRAQALVDAPSSDNSSSDSDDTNDSDSSDDAPAAEGSLLQIGSLSQPQAMAQNKQKPTSTPTNGLSIMEGFEGLVMAPVVVDTEEKSDPDMEKDSGAWMELVRPELGGGLKVTARYLHGPTREREAKVIGLDPESVTTVCLQVKFENK